VDAVRVRMDGTPPTRVDTTGIHWQTPPARRAAYCRSDALQVDISVVIIPGDIGRRHPSVKSRDEAPTPRPGPERVFLASAPTSVSDASGHRA